jgi:hypothetical protein
MGDEVRFETSFPGAAVSDANVLAQDLAPWLNDLDAVEATRQRPDPRTQDAGTALLVVMSAPATVAVARAFAAWLTRRQRATVELTRRDEQGREVKATIQGQPHDEIVQIVRTFLER